MDLNSIPLQTYVNIIMGITDFDTRTANYMLDTILGPSGLRANQPTINALKRRLTSTNNNGFGMSEEDIVGAISQFKDGRRRSARTSINFTKIFEDYRRTKTNPTTVRNTELVKRDPWFLLNTSNFTIIEVIMPGLSSSGWKIGWVNQPNAFPTAKVGRTNTATTGRIKSQTVGKVCNLRELRGRPECNNNRGILKSRGQYDSKYIKNGTPNNGYNIYKVGSAGMGVSRLSAVIRGVRAASATNKHAQQADLFEIKRNGDYGEVFTVYRLNKNRPYALLKPGDEQIAEQIATFGFSINLDTALRNNSFFYEKACFWSTDRPALFLCLLLEQPYVRVFGRQLWANLTGVSNVKLLEYVNVLSRDPTKSDPTKRNDPISIIKEIVQNKIRNKLNNTDDWFKKMCIIDTAHDFGGVRAGDKRTQEKHKESLQAYLNSTGQTYLDSSYGRRYPLWRFVDRIWPSGSIEIEFRNILDHFADPTKGGGGMEAITGQTNDPDTIRYIETRLQSKNMCIVWDSGSVPKGGLQNYIALAAAKYLDPAA